MNKRPNIQLGVIEVKPENNMLLKQDSQKSTSYNNCVKIFKSFGTERRVLTKLGKLTKRLVKRYYLIQGGQIKQYKSLLSPQHQSIYSLENCKFLRRESQDNNNQNILQVQINKTDRIIYLHAKDKEDLYYITQYISCVSQGKVKDVDGVAKIVMQIVDSRSSFQGTSPQNAETNKEENSNQTNNKTFFQKPEQIKIKIDNNTNKKYIIDQSRTSRDSQQEKKFLDQFEEEVAISDEDISIFFQNYEPHGLEQVDTNKQMLQNIEFNPNCNKQNLNVSKVIDSQPQQRKEQNHRQAFYSNNTLISSNAHQNFNENDNPDQSFMMRQSRISKRENFSKSPMLAKGQASLMKPKILTLNQLQEHGMMNFKKKQNYEVSYASTVFLNENNNNNNNSYYYDSNNIYDGSQKLSENNIDSMKTIATPKKPNIVHQVNYYSEKQINKNNNQWLGGEENIKDSDEESSINQNLIKDVSFYVAQFKSYDNGSSQHDTHGSRKLIMMEYSFDQKFDKSTNIQNSRSFKQSDDCQSLGEMDDSDELNSVEDNNNLKGDLSKYNACNQKRNMPQHSMSVQNSARESRSISTIDQQLPSVKQIENNIQINDIYIQRALEPETKIPYNLNMKTPRLLQNFEIIDIQSVIANPCHQKNKIINQQQQNINYNIKKKDLQITIPHEKEMQKIFNPPPLAADIIKSNGNPINKVTVMKFLFPKKEEELLLNTIVTQEEALEKGVDFLWQFQFNNAVSCFNKFKEHDINFEYFMLEPLFLEIVVSGKKHLIQETETQISQFIERLLLIEKNYELYCKAPSKQPNNNNQSYQCISMLNHIDLDLLKSETLLIKGLLQAFLNNKIQAFFSFKSAWDFFCKIKENVDIRKIKIEDFSKISQSRYYFVAGIFNIGLSMIPNYFLKILQLIGINPVKEYGLECLNKCLDLNFFRSNYAGLLLALEFVELNPDVQKAVQLIKRMMKKLPKSPIFYWMASLLSWRYSKPDDALQLIGKSIWHCGEGFSKEAYYLKFEKGWFNISLFQWEQAAKIFEEIATVSLDLANFDRNLFNQIAKSKGINHPIDLSSIQTLADITASQKTNDQIILPHKCCLALLLASCYEKMGNNNNCTLWLIMVLYLLKKFSDSKTNVDEDLSKLAIKYLKRENKEFMKYEVLYFVKEISKLREDILQLMQVHVEDFFKKQPPISNSLNELRQPDKKSKVIDILCASFLRIVYGCLNQNMQIVYQAGEDILLFQDLVPSESTYLLHHSYHWLARCYMSENKYQQAKDFFKRCLKYSKCEFSLENKSEKLLTELKFVK